MEGGKKITFSFVLIEYNVKSLKIIHTCYTHAQVSVYVLNLGIGNPKMGYKKKFIFNTQGRMQHKISPIFYDLIYSCICFYPN